MLRDRWSQNITTTLKRPVLIVDEAQETLTTVLNELRVLASKELDSQQILCVIFAGDLRLPNRFRSPEPNLSPRSNPISLLLAAAKKVQ